MATERLSMRNTREVLRQKWVLKKSHREVASSVGISVGGVARVIERATVAALTWGEVQGLDDGSLEKALFGERPMASAPQRPLPDPVYIHTERRRPGVTLELLHQEYLEKHPDGYRYTQFCEYYRKWLDERRLTMRQVHRAGEKAFLDYSGNKPRLVEQTTGVVTEAELFVAVLGASNYTFAEATRTQSSPDWISSNIHALEYFNGVPRALIPDQLRSGVTQPCRYEPGVQRTYAELARHYGTAVIPARPGKARDKAKVEVGVLIAQRWILARLRHETFFTLERLNERIAELVEELNGRRMRLYGASRREMFERLEKPVLQKLPERRFEYAEWKRVGIGIDYHVELDHHFYSVPHVLRPEKSLEARFTATTIELFLRGERVASHVRSYQRGGHTTVPEHMPKAHQKHMEWSPTRIVHWAGSIGPNTQALAQAILADRPHPEMGYRSCLGILRLAKQYGNERLEAASGRALAVGARSYRHVAEILKRGLDRVALEKRPASTPEPPPLHENVRGRDYYH
jgi:transposase